MFFPCLIKKRSHNFNGTPTHEKSMPRARASSTCTYSSVALTHTII